MQTELIPWLKSICPYPIRRQYSMWKIMHKRNSFRRQARKERAETAAFLCPCCGAPLASFVGGPFLEHPERFDPKRYEKMPQQVICPVCGSLPRHRILVHWCEQHIRCLQESRILYFAQERGIAFWMREKGISCETADLYQPSDLQIDVQNTGLPDAVYDVIICNHVLEHVADYQAALQELKRILRPGGILICSFPMDIEVSLLEEEEDELSVEERIRRFGQFDHRRVFGVNAHTLLEAEGFSVTPILGKDCPKNILPVAGPADYDADTLFLCRKPCSKNDPLVSVIVPVYNVLPYLDECLESILDQSYQNFELLLIDDGSTDGSGPRCDEWAARDDRIRLIHQENHGLSGARNHGLDLAEGEWVCFVDSDDRLHHHFLQRMIETALLQDVDMVCCGHRNISDHTCWPLQMTSGLLSRSQMIEAVLRSRLGVSAWGKLYRRALWEGIRFPDGHVYEDMASTHLLMWKSKAGYALAEPLYVYRPARQGSITSTLKWELEKDLVHARYEQYHFVCDHTPELQPLARYQMERAFLHVWNRMAQPMTGCPPEELKKLRQYVITHRNDLCFSEYKSVILLILTWFCPRFSIWLYRKRKRLSLAKE